MVDPAKDYYNERLAQAAWGIGSSMAFSGPGHPGLVDNASISHSHLHPSSVGHGHGASAYALQTNYLHSTQGPTASGFDMSKSRVPNGGQNSVNQSFSYPSVEQYHQPLPAHTSLVRSGNNIAPSIAGPLPAHMRSNPYQSSPYSPLNPTYNHFHPPYGYPTVHGTPMIQPNPEKTHSAPSTHNGNNTYYPNHNHPKDFSRPRQSTGTDVTESTVNLSSHSSKSLNPSDNIQQQQHGYNVIPGFSYHHQMPPFQNYYTNPQSFLSLGNQFPNNSSTNEKSQLSNPTHASQFVSKTNYQKSSPKVEGNGRGTSQNETVQGTTSGEQKSAHPFNLSSEALPKSAPQVSKLQSLESHQFPQNTAMILKNFSLNYTPHSSATSHQQQPLATLQSSLSQETVSNVKSSSPISSGPKNLSLKRPASAKASGSESKQKYFKRDSTNTHKDGFIDATDDPYAFDDDDDANASNQSSGSLDFSRKSCNSPSGPVYKFKNALLTRTSDNGPQGSPSSSKSLPLNLDSSIESFSVTCDKLIDDLSNKPISVSRRPSLEVWQATMAARAAQKEKRKEKKVVKSDDSLSNSAASNHASFEESHPPPPELPQLSKLQSQLESKNDSLGVLTISSKSSEHVNGDKEVLPFVSPKEVNNVEHADMESKEVKIATQSMSSGNPGQTKVDEVSKPTNTAAHQSKKGALWALPIVPKPPQKQPEKRLVGLPVKKIETPRIPADASGVSGPAQAGSATDIWLQAFGVSKPKKNVEISQTHGKQTKSETDVAVSSQRNDLKTILDVPPELRRRSKPNFGGLIYFSPDWEREVLRFHEKQRVPTVLAKGIIAKPKFLLNTLPLGPSSMSPPAEMNRPVTPPNRPTVNIMSLSPSGSDDMPINTFGLSSSEGLPSTSKNVMETILENRKKLRNSITMGRMFRMPVVPEKKRYNSKGTSSQPADPSRKPDVSGLLPTPGMPLWVDSDDNQEDDVSFSSGNPFGNFRRETILRYLGDVNPELRTKILDWKPEIYETKTRRQSSQARSNISLSDIFGDAESNILPEKSSVSPLISSSPIKSSSEEEESIPPSSSTLSNNEVVLIKKRPYKKRSIVQAVEVKVECESEDEKQSFLNEEKFDTKPEETLLEKKHDFEFQEPHVKKRGRKKLSDSPVRLGRPPKNKIEGQSPSDKLVKDEPTSEIVKPKRGRKPKNAAIASTLNSSISAEEIDQKAKIKDHLEFSSGGPASGGFAAVALAIDTAKEKALEKEKPAYKRLPKKVKIKMELEVTHVDDYVPNEDEEKLQLELQNFAQELLDENKSWERRKVIQNLVIWEFIPIDPALLPPPVPGNDPVLLPPPPVPSPLKRRPKKGRKNPSGLDFAKKKTSGKNSRGVSRATSPEPVGSDVETHDISYTLDHLLAEINRWVIDKSAGETILHRAAKMGYPDAVAYALGMAKMNPKTKDNAGFPPIHKAAYRKHSEIVNMLLKFGADPNANVKGTRPLHEAIDGDSLSCVHHLLSFGADPALYDYSGNTPIDLTEDSEEMHFYFTNVLADIEGSPGSRWNVSHCEDFHMPPDELECEASQPDMEPDFEIIQQIHPPTYKLNDRPGKFVLSLDLKGVLKPDQFSKLPSTIDAIEIGRDEFLRHAVCCDLGCIPAPDIMKSDKVKLILFDTALKKYLEATKSRR